MRNPFHALLARGPERVVILDGGMGTSVEDRGVATTSSIWGSTALLTSKGRETNDAIHRDFVAAGAEILIANTHNATRECCEKFVADHGTMELDAELDASLEPSVALHEFLVAEAFRSARRAVLDDATIAVAGCISNPEGAYARESRMSNRATQDFYETELRAQLVHGPDLVILETLSTRSELQGAAAACVTTDVGDIAVGMTCRRDARTCFGVAMDEVVETLMPAQPKVWFVQCTRYDFVDDALAKLRAAVPDDAILGVYANDGRRWHGRHWHGERISVGEYADAARRWREQGARVIGGCCGTTPEHITAVRRLLVSDSQRPA